MNILKKAFIGFLLNALLLYFLVRVVDEIVYTGGFKFFIIGGLVMGLINYFIKPIIKAFSFPFIFLTGGLFLVLINAFLLWFLSYFLGILQFRDVTLDFQNLGSYVIGAIVFGIMNWTIHLFIKNK
jgi:putative membrane protein